MTERGLWKPSNKPESFTLKIAKWIEMDIYLILQFYDADMSLEVSRT